MASVSLSNVDHETGLSSLLDRHLPTLFLGHDLDAWLRDLYFLLVEVGSDLDGGMTFVFNALDGVCYGVFNGLAAEVAVDFVSEISVLVHDDFAADDGHNCAD